MAEQNKNGISKILLASILVLFIALVFMGAIIYTTTQDKYTILEQCEEGQRTIVKNLREFEGQRCRKEITAIQDKLKQAEDDYFLYQLSSVIHRLQPKLDFGTANKIAKAIIRESKTKDIDPILITALTYEESWFDPMAKSPKGAIGLMQVLYSVWKNDGVLKNDEGKFYGKDELYHIDTNIKCGTRIFLQYYDESDHNIVETLYRYNSGSKTLPQRTKYYEIDFVNKVIIRSYQISEQIKEASAEAG